MIASNVETIARNQTFDHTLPNRVAIVSKYDVRGRVRFLTHKVSDDTNAAVLKKFEYIYRIPSGSEPVQIKQWDGNTLTDTINLEYDAALRVSREEYKDGNEVRKVITYTYDDAGNRTSRVVDNDELTGDDENDVYTIVDGYELDSVNGIGADDRDFTTDNGGRVIEIEHGSITDTLTYNASDQVIGFVNGTTDVSYTIDANGDRIGTRIGTRNLKYVTAPTQAGLSSPWLIADSSNALQAAYVYAGENAIMRFDGSMTPTYYLEDAMDSVIATLNANSTIQDSFKYDSFGNTLNGVVPVNNDVGAEFGFQGAWLDGETGLYNMRARDYDPITGRFTSRDPVDPNPREAESFNVYAFANNNPLVFSDPTGMFSVSINEINVVNAIQNSFRGLRMEGLRRAREHAFQVAYDAAANGLAGPLRAYFPANMFDGLDDIDISIDFGAQGDAFEDTITNKLRGSLKNTGIDWVWLEPKVAYNGTVKEDGFSAAQKAPSDVDLNLYRKKGWPRPDFIISGHRPTQDNPSASDRPLGMPHERSWLIGDVKISTNMVYRHAIAKGRAGTDQWQAIVFHAALGNDHQQMPMALYITARGGTQAEERTIRRQGLKERTYVSIISLT